MIPQFHYHVLQPREEEGRKEGKDIQTLASMSCETEKCIHKGLSPTSGTRRAENGDKIHEGASERASSRGDGGGDSLIIILLWDRMNSRGERAREEGTRNVRPTFIWMKRMKALSKVLDFGKELVREGSVGTSGGGKKGAA